MFWSYGSKGMVHWGFLTDTIFSSRSFLIMIRVRSFLFDTIDNGTGMVFVLCNLCGILYVAQPENATTTNFTSIPPSLHHNSSEFQSYYIATLCHSLVSPTVAQPNMFVQQWAWKLHTEWLQFLTGWLFHNFCNVSFFPCSPACEDHFDYGRPNKEVHRCFEGIHVS